MRWPVEAPLRPYIESIWVFESDQGVPESSSRVIAPNGCPKLILSFRNSLDVSHRRGTQIGSEGRLHVIGVWDESSIVSSPARATGSIGIEFHPEGFSRFCGFALHEIANRVCDADEVFGHLGRDLQERLANTPSVASKVRMLQGFLIERLAKTRPVHAVLDHVSRRLRLTDGAAEISSFERETGFSRRWLDKVFQEHVGHSPKTLAAIFRFQRFYKAWAMTPSSNVLREDILDLYYDQSHFTREFKRFTGFPPGKYAQADNEFGRIFYRPDPRSLETGFPFVQENGP